MKQDGWVQGDDLICYLNKSLYYLCTVFITEIVLVETLSVTKKSPYIKPFTVGCEFVLVETTLGV